MFIYVHFGSNGRISDGGVFKNTNFYRALEEQKLGIPTADTLIDDPDGPHLPYVLVADDAFALSPNLMKPYAK